MRKLNAVHGGNEPVDSRQFSSSRRQFLGEIAAGTSVLFAHILQDGSVSAEDAKSKEQTPEEKMWVIPETGIKEGSTHDAQSLLPVGGHLLVPYMVRSQCQSTSYILQPLPTKLGEFTPLGSHVTEVLSKGRALRLQDFSTEILYAEPSANGVKTPFMKVKFKRPTAATVSTLTFAMVPKMQPWNKESAVAALLAELNSAKQNGPLKHGYRPQAIGAASRVLNDVSQMSLPNAINYAIRTACQVKHDGSQSSGIPADAMDGSGDCGVRAALLTMATRGYGEYVEGWDPHVKNIAGIGQHAWVYLVVNGKYVLVDPLNMETCFIGPQDVSHIPFSVGAGVDIPGIKRSNIYAGMNAGFGSPNMATDISVPQFQESQIPPVILQRYKEALQKKQARLAQVP